MGRKAKHQIRVSRATWEALHERKGPGDSFNDVLVRLLEESAGESGADPAVADREE